jgi:peptide-methionine (S)-S-oxide reductase
MENTENKKVNETIVLGGGCFWCIEAVFSMVKGVVDVTPGYAGGGAKNPTYEQVCSGKTGHAEVVKIEYEPKKTSLQTLLDIFFNIHDPTTLNRQGNDIGTQYRSIILYDSQDQKEKTENYIKKIQDNFDKPIVTEIKKLGHFYPAEPYHEKYFHKNPKNPYCKIVIAPKVEKAKMKFKSHII